MNTKENNHLPYQFQKVPIDSLSIHSSFFPLYEKEMGRGAQIPLALPLLVHEIATGSYEIIDGIKRFTSWQDQRVETVDVMVVSLVPPADWLMLRWQYNQARDIPFIEKMSIFAFLNQNKLEFSQQEFQSIGIFKKEIPLLKNLVDADDDIRSGVISNTIHPSSVPTFSRFPQSDRITFYEKFRDLHFSVQAEREIMEWLEEIAYRDGVSISQLLSDETLSTILSDDRSNTPQKISRVKDLLFRLRNPRISNAEDKFRLTLQRINPAPAAVRINASPWFEKERLEIIVTAKRSDDLSQIFEKLSEVNTEEWNKLLRPWTDK